MPRRPAGARSTWSRTPCSQSPPAAPSAFRSKNAPPVCIDAATKARLQIKTIHGVQFIDDSYNANPDSMKAALRTLPNWRPMATFRRAWTNAELGSEWPRGHREVGEACGVVRHRSPDRDRRDGREIAAAARIRWPDESNVVARPEEAAELLAESARRAISFSSKGAVPHAPSVCWKNSRSVTGGPRHAMMYYLHRLSEQFKGFNVFLLRHVSRGRRGDHRFCALAAFRQLRHPQVDSLKVGQPIRTADEVHQLAELHGGKQGTPTMGGVLIIGSVVISSDPLGATGQSIRLAVLFSMVYLGVLGFVDDYLKVTKKKSDGISGRIKLIFQILLAGDRDRLFPHQSADRSAGALALSAVF